MCDGMKRDKIFLLTYGIVAHHDLCRVRKKKILKSAKTISGKRLSEKKS